MLRILIVDDTKSIHAYVKMMLNKINQVTTESVYNGMQAVDLLKERNNFDLIFLDWEMPVLNGPETLKELKSLDLKIPIIMMTSKNAIEDIELVLGLGAAEYIMKPFTYDILFEKIESVTSKDLLYAV